MAAGLFGLFQTLAQYYRFDFFERLVEIIIHHHIIKLLIVGDFLFGLGHTLADHFSRICIAVLQAAQQLIP